MEKVKSKQHLRPSQDQICEFVARHELTYAQIADICGVRSEAVRDWIKGRSSMPVAVWRLLKLTIEGEKCKN